MFVPQQFDSSLKGSDFYKFVNGKWLHTVNVPPHISSYGISEELEQSIERVLQEILQRCIIKSKQVPTNPSYDESIEIAIGNVAYSALNPKIQKKGV